tara:strand:+ start:880 stop:1026 length:147 start_codon:yes stop_codon:yes gene_type:complete
VSGQDLMLGVVWHILSGHESEFDMVDVSKHGLNEPSGRLERVIMDFFI